MDNDCRLIFDNLPGIYLILKPDAPDFTIVDFNQERSRATWSGKSIIGHKLFDAFTDDNTNDPGATGVANLRASLMNVIETKKPHKMALQCYNLLITKSNEFEERYWSPVNIPVLDKDKSLKYIIHVVEDVTEKVLLQQQGKQSQEELEHLHKEQSGILESIEDAFISTDRNWIVKYWNKQAEVIFNISRKEILGNYLWDFILKEGDGKLYKCFHKALQNSKPAHFQEYYALRDVWLQANVYPSKEGITAFLVNITEIKKAEEELHAVEKSYHARLKQEVEQRTKELKENKGLLQSVLDVSLNSFSYLKAIRNEKGAIVDFEWVLANHTIEERLKQGPLLGKRFTAVYPDEKTVEWLQKCIEVVETGVTADFEDSFELNGTLQWFHILAQKFNDGFVFTASLITERKKAELELTESKSFIEKITTTIPDLITIHDLGTNKIVYTNSQSFWDNHFNPDEIYKISDQLRAAAMISPDYLEQAKLFLQERKLLTDDQTVEVELKMVNNRWIRIRSKVFKRDEKGHSTQLISVTTDITKRKIIEQELLRIKDELAQRATDKYLKLFNSIDQGFCIMELISNKDDNLVDARYLEVNPAFGKITGLKNAVGKTNREMGQDFVTDNFNLLSTVLVTGAPVRFEKWVQPLEKWIEGFAFRFEPSQENQIAILFNDITTRKRIVQWQTYLLKLSDSLRSLADPVEIQGTAAHVLGRQLHASRCFYSEIVNNEGIEYFSVEQVYHTPDAPMPVSLYPVDSFGKLMDELRAGRNVVIDNIESTSMITTEDQAAYDALNIHAFVAIPLIKNNNMVALLAAHQTSPRKWKPEEMELMLETAERTWAALERAKAEEAVRRNEQRFRALFENISDGLIIISPKGTIRELSISAQKLLGYDFKYFKGQNYKYLFFSADLLDIEKAFQNTLKSENIRQFYSYFGKASAPGETLDNSQQVIENSNSATVQFRFIKQGEGIKWMEGNFHNLLHEETIRSVVFTFRDITDRRIQEQQLQASEEKYRYLFQNNPAAIIIWTLDDYWVREVNEAACRLYGYTRIEFLCKTFLDLKPGEQAKEIDQERKLILNNAPGQDVWQHKTRNGDIIYMNMSFHKISYEGIDAVLALGINVTENILLQRKLEDERQRKEIEITEAVITAQENERAELGRELHDNISQILTTSRMYIEYSLSKKEKQAELIQHSHEYISKAIKEIRQISHTLMLPSLSDVSLKQSLEELFLNLKSLSDFKFHFEFLLLHEKNLSDNLKLAIFRIIQEGLNNVFRHAKATEIVVHIEQKGNTLEVCINDNGKGFDPQRKTFGLGLRNIISRANLFRGDVVLDSQPGKGTQLKVEFPIKEA